LNRLTDINLCFISWNNMYLKMHFL